MRDTVYRKISNRFIGGTGVLLLILLGVGCEEPVMNRSTADANLDLDSGEIITGGQSAVDDSLEVCSSGAEETRPCGLNQRGQERRSCISDQVGDEERRWSTWSSCVDPDVCVDDATDTGGDPCGLNGRGTDDRICIAGTWESQETCSNDPDICVDDSIDTDGDSCGLNGRGTDDRICIAGAWEPQETCSNDPDVCVDDSIDTDGDPCGLNGRGTDDRICLAGAWEPQETCSNDPDVCVDDATDTNGDPCGLNGRGTDDRICIAGAWEPQERCSNDPDVCVDDAVDTNGDPCGLNGRGTDDRICLAGTWESQETCNNDPDVCVDDTTDTGGEPCGLNRRGTHDRICLAGAWESQETCSNDPDVCVDDTTDTGGDPCGLNDRGTGDRLCLVGTWESQESCSNDPDVCIDDAIDIGGAPCGLNGRGTDTRRCVEGAWQPEGVCNNDPDECVDGMTDLGDTCSTCQGGRWVEVNCPCDGDDLRAPCNGCQAGILVPLGFVCAPPGDFTQGEGGPPGVASRQVTLTGTFFIQETEVTQEEWQTVMGSNPAQNQSCGATCPVETLRWSEAVRFANAKSSAEGLMPCYSDDGELVGGATLYDCEGYRLLTDAEWGYAYRAGTQTIFHWGDDSADANEYAWYVANAGSTTHPVATKQPNAWGLYDMAGNVNEWVHDWYTELSADPATDPWGPATGQERVIRGSSIFDPVEQNGIPLLGEWPRGYSTPDGRQSFIGLRLARSYLRCDVDGARDFGGAICGLNGRGTGDRVCVNRVWRALTICSNDPDVCVDGATDSEGDPCGLNSRGTADRLCMMGAWEPQDTCSNDPDVCIDGSAEVRPCGLNGRGMANQTCVVGTWELQGLCDDPDECTDGTIDTDGPACGLNDRGTADRLCVTGTWQPQETCSTDPDECVDDATDTDGEPCGLNGRGTGDRLCVAGLWQTQETCSNDPDECVDGIQRANGCAICEAGQWIPLEGSGSCEAGAVCDTAGECCMPMCDGLACGDNGCGGSCGECDAGDVCDAEGQCASLFTWVGIEGGTFSMGRRGVPDAEPVHSVTLGNYIMTQTEVTVEQYRFCVDAGVCSVPNVAPGCNWTDSPIYRRNHPINCVSWDQTRVFADWVGWRLPTETEWEFAARSRGQDHVFPWGNAEPTRCNNRRGVFAMRGCSPQSTREVGSDPRGETIQGLQDMAGNVEEWVEDLGTCRYPLPTDGSAARNIPGEALTCSTAFRRTRGGSWDSRYGVVDLDGRPVQSYLETSARRGRLDYERSSRVGFRLVRSAVCIEGATDTNGPACGFNGRGTDDQTCVGGRWQALNTCSNDPDVCVDGATDMVCGLNERGTGDRICVAGTWELQGSCNDPDECIDLATDTNGPACGLNGRGTDDRTCVVGAWQSQNTCSNDPDICVDNVTDTGGASCGLNGRGTGDRLCVVGAWQPQESCSNDPDICVDGLTDTGGASCGLNGRGTGDRLCVVGAWQPQESCSNDPDICVDGSTDTSGDPCGLNGRGTGDRLCVVGTWQPQNSCSTDPDVCVDGDADIRPCGLNDRGTGDHTCVVGEWELQGLCNDPDVCVDDATDTGGPACGLNGRGTNDRLCMDGAWLPLETCSNDPDECVDGVQQANGCAVCEVGSWTFLEGSGACEEGDVCDAVGQCCTPNCDGRSCGDNGCGGNCGECEEGDVCSATGQCGFVMFQSDEFWMGSPVDESRRDDDEVYHLVTIEHDFLLQTAEVTRAQWEALMNTSPWSSRCEGETCPVETVNWFEAAAFANALSVSEGLPECYRLADCNGEAPGDDYECETVEAVGVACDGYRLPTEAEWEYAARSGGLDQRYPWGDAPATCDRAVMSDQMIRWSGCGSGGPLPRCSRPEGNSAQGVCDLIGNVAEWTEDWYGDYEDAPVDGSARQEATEERVTRGGLFSSPAHVLRATNRYMLVPGSRGYTHGFRLARSVR